MCKIFGFIHWKTYIILSIALIYIVTSGNGGMDSVHILLLCYFSEMTR